MWRSPAADHVAPPPATIQDLLTVAVEVVLAIVVWFSYRRASQQGVSLDVAWGDRRLC